MNLDYLYEIFRVLLIMIFTIGTPIATVALIKLKTKTDTKIANSKYVESLRYVYDCLYTTVRDVVTEVNETFVNELKKSGKFTKANQKKAFNTAFEKTKSILGDTIVNVLSELNNNIDNVITSRIETEVKWQKPYIPEYYETADKEEAEMQDACCEEVVCKAVSPK